MANFGVRYDRFNMVEQQTESSPRVKVGYKSGDGTLFHAAYNQLFVPPPIEYLLLPSQALVPECEEHPVPGTAANHYAAAGIGYRLRAWATVDVTGFDRRCDQALETAEIAEHPGVHPGELRRGRGPPDGISIRLITA